MPGEDIYSWSTTALSNDRADTAIEWREGQARATVNNSSRAMMAAHAKNRNLLNGSIVTGGSANAQTFTSGVGYIAPIPTGLIVKLKIGAGLTNTATATLNMDGIGDTVIKTDTGEELLGGELVGGCYTDFLFNGTNWIFLYSREFFQELISGGDGVIIGKQIFSTPGSFTYTPTVGAEAFVIECIGGGGGGGTGQSPASGQWYSGGGGGGGGYSRKIATVADIGGSQPVIVGAGGINTSPQSFASDGSPTSVGAICVANGGKGGVIGSHSAVPSIGGAGAAPGVGDIAAAGNAGGAGIYSQEWTTGMAGGSGGAGPFGGGGLGSGGTPATPSNAYGGAGGSYGGGGGGGSSANGIDTLGGNGGGGLVIITEFAGRGAPGRDGSQGPIGPMGPSGAGTGDVLRFGTPTTGQIARWVSASQIEGVDIAFFTTGDAKLTFKTTADAGWVMADDGSIGNAGSGATTRAHADTSALFVLLWTNVAALVVQDNTGATVARGASGAADFTANRRLVLPKALGRTLAVAGSGAGLTARTLGAAVGEETHVLSTAELPSHSHSITTIPASGGTFVVGSGTTQTVPVYGGDINSTNPAGGGIAHNVMQPTSFLNVMIKL